jgi:hypothetical protein
MRQLSSSFFVIAVCLQIMTLNLSMSHASIFENIHELTEHSVTIDHHHHDPYLSHLDHEDIDTPHLHITDSFQTIGLLATCNKNHIFSEPQVLRALSDRAPLEVFLKKPLRPPRINT